MKKVKITWVNIEMPDDLHGKVKAAAAFDGVSLKHFILETLREKLRKPQKPQKL